MFLVSEKKRLYWLINQYLDGRISAWTFTGEIHDCYDVNLDLDTLSVLEQEQFSSLSMIAGRFSNSLEDLQKYPGVYYSEAELKAEVIKVKQNLHNEFAKLVNNNF